MSPRPSVDPLRAYRWQPNTENMNPNWVPQFQPATRQRPLSFVHKKGFVSRLSSSDSSDTTVPAWAKVKDRRVANPLLSGANEREPVANYKWSSKAGIPPPSEAFITGNLAARRPFYEPAAAALALAPTPAPASVPPVPERREDSIHRYTIHSERTSVRRASVAARTSQEYVPPLPSSEPQETGSSEGEEFEIPDFKYSVPHTPRYSSLPQHRTGPSSGLEVDPEHSFPPTPPSTAAQYAHLYTPRTAGTHIVVSPMSAMDPQQGGIAGDQPVPNASEIAANVFPRLVKVVGIFKPTLGDELTLSLGETLRLLHVFPDDWCLVQRLFPQESGEPRTTTVMESGAVPILCLADIGTGAPVPRVQSSTLSSPSAPVSSARDENILASPSKSAAISEGSGVSGTSGQTGGTGTTNRTETSQLSEPRSHWSSATSALGSQTPITPPETHLSAGQVVKTDQGDMGQKFSPLVPSPGSSVASGQSLVVPPGLSGAGYMPRMPKKLDQVPKLAHPTHRRTNSSNRSGTNLRNGGFTMMLDRTRAS